MADHRNWLIDHTGIGVSDIHRSARFYEAALRPLGMKIVMRISREFALLEDSTADLGGVAFGIDYPVFWVDVFHPHGVKQHTALRAHSREQVNEFHRAALLAGGTDNGGPGLRTGGYPPGYYAAFVLDPDGNNVEALFRTQKPTAVAQTLIAVRNVRASSRWYRELLGADSLPEHAHRDTYDRLSSCGQVLLQLHAWDEEDHPNLVNAAAAPVAHGVVLWFQLEDFDSALERAYGSGAEIVEGPFVNPAPQHREIWLRDPDGYVVVISSPDGEATDDATA